MVKVTKRGLQFIAENVVTFQHMEDGVVDDFIRKPSILNKGDDWVAGGDSLLPLLAGKYGPEPGDDFIFQGFERQGANGMAGFDGAIHNEGSQFVGSGMSGSIFTSEQIDILLGRFDLVEGLAGWTLSDKLTGREVVIGDLLRPLNS